MKKHTVILIFFLFVSLCVNSQKPKKLNSNQIYEQLQKLNFLGSVLYIAAHPDDENTRLISYFSNKLHARTGYLSLTRGDGGQNLIGPEIRELLGVIRTQELLAARNIDGGEQIFTRANDFGYSKHPDETLEIWEKDKVLSDVVWAIRTFKPDIIINRFDANSAGKTHGHHTSSAMLSTQAFLLAGDKNKFKNQLKYTKTWSPNRLFFNTSWWFYGSRERFKKANKSKMLKIDVGVYYPLKGLSNNELASMASSQHLCQGFGRVTTRGSQTEYIEFLKGDFPKDKNDIFSGINTTWNRIKGGGKIGEVLYKIEKNFDFKNPSKHISQLMKAYGMIQNIEDVYWKNIKTTQITAIITACAGLYLEASAVSSSTTPNSTISVNFEALNRSDSSIKLTSIIVLPKKKIIAKNIVLKSNKKINFEEQISVDDIPYSSPYWLNDKGSLGMYKVENQQLIGQPETPKKTKIEFHLLIDNQKITILKNVIHRFSKRDKGEIYEPFEILPKVTTRLKNKVLIFSDNNPQKVAVIVKSGAKKIVTQVQLEAPKGWRVVPNKIQVKIEEKGDAKTIEFTVFPPKNQSEGKLKSVAFIDKKKYDKELIEIKYNHIPKQSILLPSEAKVVRLDILKAGNNIGYIKGAGDVVPESLRQIGYTVLEINPNEINKENLRKYDAIVVGIRAYNTISSLKFKQKFLLEYVKKGGNLIVQYNTNRGVNVKAPYTLQLSRDRVTDENAKVTILEKNHSLLNFPNKITDDDFNGWVQERGLYFPNKWSKEYTPILSMHDKGETAKNGSLLVAKLGKGNYIYTGLSFFRELPAGVSGAYKLFANMLSIGKENIKTDIKLEK